MTHPATAEPTRCRRCHRIALKLTDGYGEKCFRRVRKALDAVADRLASFSDDQLNRATDAVTDGALVPIAAVYAVVSSDGADRYQTTPHFCSCKAGSYGRPCYHRAAVIMQHAIATA